MIMMATMMSWYFNNDGAADGPYDDEAMAALVVQKRIQAQTLIWHPGIDVWQEIVALAPPWWKAPPTPNTKSDKAAGGGRGFAPNAPSHEEKSSETPSFFKRLFGWIKK